MVIKAKIYRQDTYRYIPSVFIKDEIIRIICVSNRQAPLKIHPSAGAIQRCGLCRRIRISYLGILIRIDYSAR